MRSLILRTALTLALSASGTAWAQLIKPSVYPPPKDGLILFDMLRPIEEERGLLHGWRANLGYQYASLESKIARQPERRDLNTEILGLNVRVAERGFAGLDLSLSDQTLNITTSGSINNADVNEGGARLTGGYMLLPALAVGGSVARNKLDGTYRFGAGAPDEASGALLSYSAFMALLYPVAEWKLSLTAAYTHDEVKQSFDDGTPRDQKAWTHSGTVVVAGLHPIVGRLEGLASLAWTHIVDQRSFLAGRTRDDDWLRPAVGLIYKWSDQASLSLVASRFLMNDAYDYESVAVGLSYRF
jgi:hypothetical protein